MLSELAVEVKEAQIRQNYERSVRPATHATPTSKLGRFPRLLSGLHPLLHGAAIAIVVVIFSFLFLYVTLSRPEYGLDVSHRTPRYFRDRETPRHDYTALGSAGLRDDCHSVDDRPGTDLPQPAAYNQGR